MTAMTTAAAPTTTAAAAADSKAPGFLDGKKAGSIQNVVVRLEGLAIMAIALTAYFMALGGSGGFLAATFLLPDIAIAAWLINPRIGALAYNSAHTYLAGGLLGAVGFALGSTVMLQLGVIWAAHVGFDRALGYGLKYGDATFFDTHLGRI